MQVLGGSCAESSKKGFYAFDCDGDARAVAWNADKCFSFPLSHGVPNFCFGSDHYHNRYLHKTSLDEDVDLAVRRVQ